ncbi:MAG: hypothetical protein AAFW81_08645 [Pseudomonadota bacterium]
MVSKYAPRFFVRFFTCLTAIAAVSVIFAAKSIDISEREAHAPLTSMAQAGR